MSILGSALSEVTKSNVEIPNEIPNEIPKVEDVKDLPTSNPLDSEWKSDTENSDESIYIICRNESLEGDCHPISGIEFERKTVELPDGIKVEGVFPKFESKFDAQLDESQYNESDAKHFKEANKQLKEAIENDPELRSQFTEEQLEQIEAGDTPEGYVWHHSEEPGTLQLVDSTAHAQTGHTGGRTVWGGGSENR